MEKISNMEAAILGLLCEGPMHAFQMEKIIECRSMREWTEISMSSIYKLLRSLEKRGLASGETSLSSNNVAKKVYSITDSGKKAMKDKVSEIMSEPEKIIWRMDLGVSNLSVLTKKETESCLNSYLKKLDEAISCYGALLEYLKKENCPDYRLALASRPMALYRAEKEWAIDYMKSLSLKRGGEK